MDEIDKFIIDISKEIEPYSDELDWEFFEDKYHLDKFYLDNKLIHIDSLEWILNNAFNENPQNCVKMLELICYKYHIDYDFSSINNEINLINKENDIEFPKKAIDDLRIFISYSSADNEEAMRIYQIFKDADIHCFYANEELKAGEIWDERIFEELVSADIFIFLISDNYKSSFWCNQEASIGFLKFKLNNSIVIPLLLDDTKPYGIFYSIQGDYIKNFRSIEDFAKLIDSDSISFESAIEKVAKKQDLKLINNIDRLRFSKNFYESNKIFKELKNKRLTVNHVQKIIDFALLNDQVLRCFEFENFFNKYKFRFKDELDKDALNKIRRLLR